MSDQAPADGALFAMDSPSNGESELERAVKASIAAIDAKKPIDPTRRALCFIAVELARNISAGNRKARAVANEAQQLTTTLQLIEGVEEAGSAEQLPPDVMALVNALATPPQQPPAATHAPAVPA